MRNVTFAAVLLVAGGAFAQGTAKAKDATASAKAALDKADEAFNAHDAKALAAMVDKTFFGEGPTVSARFDTAEAFTKHIEEMSAKGGHLTREALTVKPDEDGNSAWYIADYTFVPKVPPGALPVHRKMRESGVLVKHGKEWKFAMTHMSVVQPDENAQMGPPSTAAPVKK